MNFFVNISLPILILLGVGLPLVFYYLGRWIALSQAKKQLDAKIGELVHHKVTLIEFRESCAHLHPAFDLISKHLDAAAKNLTDPPGTLRGTALEKLRQQLVRMLVDGKLS